MFDNIIGKYVTKTKGRMPEAQFIEALSKTSKHHTPPEYFVPLDNNCPEILAHLYLWWYKYYSDFLYSFVTAAKKCMYTCNNTALDKYSKHLFKYILSTLTTLSLGHLRVFAQRHLSSVLNLLSGQNDHAKRILWCMAWNDMSRWKREKEAQNPFKKSEGSGSPVCMVTAVWYILGVKDRCLCYKLMEAAAAANDRSRAIQGGSSLIIQHSQESAPLPLEQSSAASIIAALWAGQHRVSAQSSWSQAGRWLGDPLGCSVSCRHCSKQLSALLPCRPGCLSSASC